MITDHSASLSQPSSPIAAHHADRSHRHMNFNLRALNRAHARGARMSDGGAGATAAVALDERLPRRSRTEQLIERAAREAERRAKYVGRLQVREHQCLRADMGTNIC